jgi:hypothetical protein
MRQVPTSVGNSPIPGEGGSFVGSWLVTVFETEGPPTRMLLTMGADGTFVSAEHPVVTPPGAPGAIFTSSGHGAWKASSSSEALFTCIGLGSDGNGNLFAVVTFRGNLALGTDRHTLKGEMIATIDDPQGNTMATFPMTMEGTRIIAETLSVPSSGAWRTASGS